MEHLDEQHCLAYVEGELTAAEAARFEELVALNPQLSDRLKQMRVDRDRLRRLADEDPPLGLLEPVHNRLERDMLLHDTPTRCDADAAGKRWHTFRLATFSGLAAIVVLSTGLILYTLSDSKLSRPIQSKQLALGPSAVDSLEEASPPERALARLEKKQVPAETQSKGNLRAEVSGKDADIARSVTERFADTTIDNKSPAAAAPPEFTIQGGRLVLKEQEAGAEGGYAEADAEEALDQNARAAQSGLADASMNEDIAVGRARRAKVLAKPDPVNTAGALALGGGAQDTLQGQKTDQPERSSRAGTGFPFELRVAKKNEAEVDANTYTDTDGSESASDPVEGLVGAAEWVAGADQPQGVSRDHRSAEPVVKPSGVADADVVIHVNSREPGQAIEIITAWARKRGIALDPIVVGERQRADGYANDDELIKRGNTEAPAATRVRFDAPALGVLDLTQHINQHAGHVAQPVAIPMPSPKKVDWQKDLGEFFDEDSALRRAVTQLRVEMVIVQRRSSPGSP